jgi:hypothetical protein
MEPDRSTIDRAWIRRHGGRYLTVPLSNFLGCFVAAWRSFRFSRSTLRGIRRLDILNDQNYGDVLSRSTVCAGISFRSMARPVVLDAPEQAWHTQTILLAESAASVFIMGGFATSAWRRSARKNMRAELTHNPEGSTNRLVLGNAVGTRNSVAPGCLLGNYTAGNSDLVNNSSVISGLAVTRPELREQHPLGLNFVHALTDSSSRYGISSVFAACSTPAI